MKIKMLSRHTAPWGEKLEQGLPYDLGDEYAQELIKHGLAVLVVDSPPMIEKAPGFVATQTPPRTKSGRFRPRGKS